MGDIRSTCSHEWLVSLHWQETWIKTLRYYWDVIWSCWECYRRMPIVLLKGLIFPCLEASSGTLMQRTRTQKYDVVFIISIHISSMLSPTPICLSTAYVVAERSVGNPTARGIPRVLLKLSEHGEGSHKHTLLLTSTQSCIRTEQILQCKLSSCVH